MGRAERMILIIVGIGVSGIMGSTTVLFPVLWVFVVLSGFTVLQRIRRTWQQLDA